jgi:hypothetical protein
LLAAVEPSAAPRTPQLEPAVNFTLPALRLPAFVIVDDVEAEPPESAAGNAVPEQLALAFVEIVDVLV